MPSRTLRLTLGVCLALFSFLGRANAQWHPSGLQNWQWQLTTPVDTSLNVPVFDIDGFDNDASVVSTLHAKGAKVICYIDVGTYENFRSDQASFPASVKGSSNGWPGEQWLDIRQISVLAPILNARFQMCKSKGFDAVEPDNIDGYSNSTGFPLTAADQLTFNRWVATQVHALGMSVGLKNDVDQVSQLVGNFDWALDEQCHEFNECSTLDPFVSAGKTVFITEYTAFNQSICTSSNAAGYSTIFKDLNLTAPVHSCVTGGSTGPTDTTPPSVPAGLSASPTSSSSITLSWSASTDNVAVTGYRIARAGVVVGTSAATNFTNPGLSAGTSYTYTVAAFDAAGNVSGFSASASATTSTNTGAPKILSFTALPVTIAAGGNSTLSWNVTGATTLSISGIGAVTGTSKTVAPTSNTTYVLTATNASGSATASTTVTIISGGGGGGGGGLGGITSFTASPTSISSGQSSTLSWVVTGAGTANTHKFLIYYGIPATVNGSATTAAAAAVFAGYDTIVLGDGLEDPASPQHASTVAVISAVKALKPAVQIYGYVDIGRHDSK
jgi:chitodextrinase